MSVVSGTSDVLRPCWAVATSGVPVREKLFNVSICHYYSHLNFFPHGDFSRSFHRNSYDTSNIEAATPILVPRDDGHRHMKGSHGDVIFLASNGEV
jgi:Zn-dependent peptidase ImmA (M78 family)